MDEPQTIDSNLNQTMHRTEGSVWDRQGWNGTPEQFVVTRALIGIGGTALALQGLRQGRWQGGVLASLGSTLAWWALTCQGDPIEARRWVSKALGHRPWSQARRDDQMVTDASADSFPASDSPSFTPAVGTGLRRKVRP